jgi:hypothetical protein
MNKLVIYQKTASRRGNLELSKIAIGVFLKRKSASGLHEKPLLETSCT